MTIVAACVNRTTYLITANTGQTTASLAWLACLGRLGVACSATILPRMAVKKGRSVAPPCAYLTSCYLAVVHAKVGMEMGMIVANSVAL